MYAIPSPMIAPRRAGMSMFLQCDDDGQLGLGDGVHVVDSVHECLFGGGFMQGCPSGCEGYTHCWLCLVSRVG